MTRKVISDWHYKMLFVEMSKRGYRVSEPDGAAREASLVLPKLLSSLYQQDRMTRAAIADKLALPLTDLEDLLFSLVMTGVNGGRVNSKAGNPALLTRVK